jgi:hypothetical protein
VANGLQTLVQTILKPLAHAHGSVTPRQSTVLKSHAKCTDVLYVYLFTPMRYRVGLLIILTLSACSRKRQAQRDQDSAAFKVGAAAHEIAKDAEKTAAAAERQLQESARKAKEGWKQKEREEREKDGQSR